jgi:hypothetical protein
MVAGAVAAEEDGPAIDPQVRETIERMGRYLDSLKSFRIAAEAISDEIDEETGSRHQFGSAIEAMLERPNHLRITRRTAVEHQEFRYDGASFTLHDVDKKLYGVIPFAGDVGSALEHAHEVAGIVPPLADLLYERPDEALMKRAETGVYLGQDLAGGVLCDHLAFRQEGVDWQVWIEVGEQPFPRKLVITTREGEGHPQFSAQIRSFEPNPTLAPDLFRFSPGEGDERIEFLPPGEEHAGEEEKP